MPRVSGFGGSSRVTLTVSSATALTLSGLLDRPAWIPTLRLTDLEIRALLEVCTSASSAHGIPEQSILFDFSQALEGAVVGGAL